VCNRIGNSVAAPSEGKAAMQSDARILDWSLHAPGGRKYLSRDERQRALAALATLAPEQSLFVRTLAWTGARVSEVLALTPSSFQVEPSVVMLRTLKRRKFVMREVPIPPELMTALDRQFQLSAIRRDPRAADHRLWPWHRATAWRLVKTAMRRAQIIGPQACGRGFRHAFGVLSLQAGVPLNLVQRWLGHARMSTTAIYADAIGPEEAAFARKFWAAEPGGTRVGSF
jgi:integrase/recombinase XerD